MGRWPSHLLALWLFVGIVYGIASPLTLDLYSAPRPNVDAAKRLVRRGTGPVGGQLSFNSNSFFVKASIGTPPQQLQWLVDTNSADLLAPAPSNPVCDNKACAYGGTYRANKSSTYQYLNSNYSVTFGGGTTSRGDYATDIFHIEGSELLQMRFAIGYNGTVSADPILGIGYIGIEETGTTGSYANLPVRLYNKGLSNIVGYSLWFNRTSSSASNPARLIFGGIDTNQFYGTLETVPISMTKLQYQLVTLQMSSMTLTTNSNKTTNLTTSPLTVVLDSGTSGLVFSPNILTRIGTLLGAVNDTSIGGYYVQKYSELHNKTTIDVAFGTMNISIPVSDLVVQYNDTHAFLNLLSSTEVDNVQVIGLPFFRNAYTVYDYSHNQVSLAPLVHHATTANVTAISENGAAGLTGKAFPGTESTSGGGLSTGAEAGIGVGVGLGALIILGLLAFFFWRRHRQKRAAPGAEDDDATLGHKAELPAAERERQMAEKDGSGPRHLGKGELPGTMQPPPAELYPGVNGQTRAEALTPQELPGDVPKPLELATDFNTAGHAHDREPMVSDSAVSDLSGTTPGRGAPDDLSHVSPQSRRGASSSRS